MNAKKLISLLLALVMLGATLAACGGNKDGETDTDTETETETERVLSTVTPNQIIYNNFEDAKTIKSSTGCYEAVLPTLMIKDEMVDLFLAEDFELEDVTTISDAKFETIVLKREKQVVTIYWNNLKRTARVMWESETAIEPLTPTDETGTGSITFAQIGTDRVEEKDNPLNGMCYVIKMSNGKALIIDGGFINDKCADNIYKTLGKMGISKNSEGKYEIEAWLFSHGHGDHTGGFQSFCPKYASKVDLKYIMYNFPGDDEVCVNGCDEYAFETFWRRYFFNTQRINPHAGLKYYFGNVTIDMLYTPDMLYTADSQMDYYNDTSMIFKLSGGGASALMFGDSGENAATAMWEAYKTAAFKSNIIQVTHHALYTQAKNGHVWTNMKRVYDATGATYAVLPMHSRYTEEERNGRYTVMVQWTNAGYQISYFTNKANNNGDTSISQSDFDNFVESVKNGTNEYDTLYGYDGVNKIVNAKGLVTYTGGNNYSPMATIFTFSNGKATLTTNTELYSWLG